jgi:4'-phosphopantetheinyl transferase EntD
MEATPDCWTAPLHPSEAACVERAVDKRVREFAAGRSCARRALSALGVSAFPLVASPDRTPLWPTGVVGSISHCNDYCAAVVARRADITSLGLDVEPLTPLDAELLPLICSAEEIDALDALPRSSGPDWPKLVFSAKESTYKCYYPLAKTILEFHDVVVEIEPQEQKFTARLVQSSAPSAAGHREFHGHFRYDTTHLFTGVVLT